MPSHINYFSSPSTETNQHSSVKQLGFSLVEMAIVLVIVGLLLTGGLTIFTAQQEMQRVQTTTTMLETAKEALLGFAAANGRLPCPASATSAGRESFCTNPGIGACGAATIVPTVTVPPDTDYRCSNQWDGFLPAATLGFTPIDGTGYAIDAWNASPVNRIRYAVSNYYNAGNLTHPFTTPNGIQTVTMQTLAAVPAPDLVVCSTATGITATTCGAIPPLTNNAVAILYSLGKNAATATGGTGVDETANPNPNSVNNDRVFVSHERREVGGTNGEFDDIVTWLSPNVLYNRMLAAGRLP